MKEEKETVELKESNSINEKQELIGKLIKVREEEKTNCLKEIQSVCEKYKFKLEAEVIINHKGNFTNVFLRDLTM